MWARCTSHPSISMPHALVPRPQRMRCKPWPCTCPPFHRRQFEVCWKVSRSALAEPGRRGLRIKTLQRRFAADPISIVVQTVLESTMRKFVVAAILAVFASSLAACAGDYPDHRPTYLVAPDSGAPES